MISRDINKERDAVEYLLKRAADFERHAKVIEAQGHAGEANQWRRVAGELFVQAVEIEARL